MIFIDFIRRFKARTIDRARFFAKCRAIVHCATQQPSPWSCPKTGLILWAHASVGVGYKYMNSLEAINRAVDMEFDVVEIDIGLTSDGVPVLTHDFRPNNEMMFDETPTLSQFLATKLLNSESPITLDRLLADHAESEVRFSIDPCHCAGGFDLPTYLERHASASFLKRIIYQCYSLGDLYRFANGHCFGALHYTLQHDIFQENQWCVPQLIETLMATGVRSVSLEDQTITSAVREIVGRFSQEGFIVSVSGVNDLARCQKWCEIGVSCFNTDRLFPRQVKEFIK